MNLRLQWSLMRQDTSNTGVSDTSSIARENYTMHGLHLNSRGKKRLMQLTAGNVVGGHMLDISSIPVITHARASPFLASIRKHRGT
jgi:hypothetical protein